MKSHRLVNCYVNVKRENTGGSPDTSGWLCLKSRLNLVMSFV
jgi:hypothetical protein